MHAKNLQYGCNSSSGHYNANGDPSRECELCDLVFVTPPQAEIHFKSKMHTQAREEVDGPPTKKNRGTHFVSLETIATKKNCDECIITFRDPDHAKIHYRGKLHARIARLARMRSSKKLEAPDLQTPEESCTVSSSDPTTSFSDKDNLENDSDPTWRWYNPCDFKCGKTIFNGPLEAKNHYSEHKKRKAEGAGLQKPSSSQAEKKEEEGSQTETSHPKASPSDSEKNRSRYYEPERYEKFDPERYCETCNVELPNNKKAKNHYGDMPHRMNLLSAKATGLWENNMRTVEHQLKLDEGIRPVPYSGLTVNTDFYCYTCELPIPNPWLATEHYKDKKHLLRTPVYCDPCGKQYTVITYKTHLKGLQHKSLEGKAM